MTNPKTKTYQRRNYFIDKSFQSKFILKFCLVVVAGGLLTIALLYVSALQSTTVAIMNSRVVVKTTADFILPVLLQTVFIVVIFAGLAAIAVTLFVSHKIAGPLYRIKKVIEALGEGNFSSGFKIREKDQLQRLEDVLNQTILQIREKLKKAQGEVQVLADHADKIPHELKKSVDELKATLRFFRT